MPHVKNACHTPELSYNAVYSILQVLLQNCERNLHDHQVYRDAYMSASDWLGATTDKLNMCSDVRGDRSAIEAQLHKVEVGNLT